MATAENTNKRKAEEMEAAAEVEIDPATGAEDTRTPVTVLTGFLGSGKVGWVCTAPYMYCFAAAAAHPTDALTNPHAPAFSPPRQLYSTTS